MYFFQAGVLYSIKNAKFWPFGPILAFLSRMYTLWVYFYTFCNVGVCQYGQIWSMIDPDHIFQTCMENIFLGGLWHCKFESTEKLLFQTVASWAEFWGSLMMSGVPCFVACFMFSTFNKMDKCHQFVNCAPLIANRLIFELHGKLYFFLFREIEFTVTAKRSKCIKDPKFWFPIQ